MAEIEIELNPVDFITIGTIGPRGQRVFHLQAGQDERLVSFTIEKEQARALSEAIQEFIEDIDKRFNQETDVQMTALDMDLREPIEPMFRVAQMALAYEDITKMCVLTVNELTVNGEEEASIVRMWCTPAQMYALSLQAQTMVDAGRPSPRQNGRILYYWT